MNLPADFVKGNIKDLYDYGMESYDGIQEKWPIFWAEKDVDGDFWQSTSVIGPKLLTKTNGASGFSASPVKEGFTVYGSVWDYTDAINLSYNTVRDHQKVKDILREAAQGWGEGVKLTREAFFARFENQGGITTGDWAFNGTPESGAITDPSGDGLYDGTAASPMPFYNLTGNKRSSKGGGTYFNLLASGEVTDTSIQNLINRVQISNAYAEDDTRVTLKVDTLIAPSSLEFTIRPILESMQVAGSDFNDLNVLRGVFKNVIFWGELTDTDGIIVCTAKKGRKALKRMEPKFDFFQDKLSRSWWATVETRFGGMIDNYRYTAADNLPTS